MIRIIIIVIVIVILVKHHDRRLGRSGGGGGTPRLQRVSICTQRTPNSAQTHTYEGCTFLFFVALAAAAVVVAACGPSWLILREIKPATSYWFQ